MERDIGSWMSVLLWRPVAQFLAARDHQLHDLFHSSSCKGFPDGTVCVESTPAILTTFSKIAEYCQEGLEVDQNTHLRSLACFPPRVYKLITSGEYFNKIGGERGLCVAPGELDPPDFAEQEPASLRVWVRFRRVPDSGTRELLLGALRAWADSVQMGGMFGEGPARVLDEPVQFERKWGSFRTDVSQSGQQTVNWLTLMLLSFADEHMPITDIDYVQMGSW